MKRLCYLFFASLAFLQSNPLELNVLYAQKGIFIQSQALQRKHIEQMRFRSIYQWRAWGMMHTDLKRSFLDDEDLLVGALSQVGLDREYPLASSFIPSSVLVGVDIDGGGGDMKKGGEKLKGGGYDVGGYVLWRSEEGYFASFAIKYIQTFQQVLKSDFDNSMWAFDFGGGKRFELGEGYFLDTSANFGVGAILDSQVTFEYQNKIVTHFMEPLMSYNLLASVFMGRKIGGNEVRVGFSPMGEVYFGGKGVITTNRGYERIIEQSLSKFDILLSINYDMKFTDRIDLYTYADFYALEFHGRAGIGIRVGFSENVYTALKYPKFKLDKLKKTYLK